MVSPNNIEFLNYIRLAFKKFKYGCKGAQTNPEDSITAVHMIVNTSQKTFHKLLLLCYPSQCVIAGKLTRKRRHIFCLVTK